MALSGGAAWIAVKPKPSGFDEAGKKAGQKFATQTERAARESGGRSGGLFSKGFGKVAGNLGGGAKSLSTRITGALGKGLKRSVVGVGVAAGGALSLSLFKGFGRLAGIEQAQAKLSGLGHSAKAVDAIMKNALASVKGTAFGLDEAATVAASAVAAGVKPGKDLERTLSLVGDAATIAGTDMASMGAIFNKVAAADKVQMDVINQLHDQGVPALSLLAKEMGVTAEEASKMASAGKIDFATFQAAMETGMGGAALKSGKTFKGSMANMQAAMGRLGATLLGPIFAKAPAVIGKITTGFDKLGAHVSTTLMPLAARFVDQVKAKLLPVFASLGRFIEEKVVPPLVTIGKWLLDNKDVVKVFGGVLLAVAAAFTVVSVAVGIFNAVLAINPVVLLGLALAALAAALYFAYTRSETFRAVVDKVWTAVRTAVTVAWQQYIKPTLKELWSFIKKDVIPLLQSLWSNVVKPVFGFIGAAIKLWWKGVVQPTLKALWWFLKTVLFPVIAWLWSNVVRPVFSKVSKAIQNAWERVIKPVFNALRDFINDRLVPAFEKGVTAIGKAWDRIKSIAKKPINFVIDTVYNKGLRAGFNKVVGALGLNKKYRLPHMDKVGGGGGARGTGARAPRALQPRAAMGGAGGFGGVGDFLKGVAGGGLDLLKDIVGKGWDWTKDMIMSPVNAALGRVGDHPFAQMAKGAGSKVIGGTLGWLKDKFFGSDEVSGKVGGVLPKGRYSIGMPFLGYPGHYGSDYPAATGTPVGAFAGGFVSRAKSMAGSYGKHVFVTHANGVETRYAHLNAIGVRPGQFIQAGKQIGTVGSTGNSTGPHLHFEYRKNGAAIDPATLGVFDSGGKLPTGLSAVFNGTGRVEAVLTAQQWSDMHSLAQRSANEGPRATVQQNFPVADSATAKAAADRLAGILTGGV